MGMIDEQNDLIRKSDHKAELLKALDLSKGLMEKHHINPTSLQWDVTINHINEMINRKYNGTNVPVVDDEMKQQISDEAVTVSSEIASFINLDSIDEVYLLAIHFELARLNNDINF